LLSTTTHNDLISRPVLRFCGPVHHVSSQTRVAFAGLDGKPASFSGRLLRMVGLFSFKIADGRGILSPFNHMDWKNA
jgi:hypothetical protein